MRTKSRNLTGKKVTGFLMALVMFVCAIAASLPDITARAASEYGSGTINLMQGKNGYASSNQRGDSTVGERQVSNLTDGNTGSYIILHQDDTDPWVYGDLGAEYSVNKVVVYQGADSAYPNAYATSFTVEYTTNLSTGWKTAATVTGARLGSNTVTFSPVTARYIRIHVQQKYATNASFLELQVYETDYNKAPGTDTEPLRILFIGNSLTDYNNVAGKVKDLFTASGQEVETQTLIQLGKSLTYHASLPETSTTILNGDFDYVVMQDKASGFNGDTLKNGVTTINQWISQTGAKPVLYMPWANKSVLQTEQSNFTAGYVSVGKSINALVAPAGEVWYEFFYDYGYDWYSDNIHATNTGSLMAAATIFYTITGLDVPLTFTDADSIVATSGINAQLMNLIQERACVYAKAYRNLDNIQEPEVDVPETTIPEAASRPVLSVTDTADPSVQKVSTNATVTASSEVQSGALAVDGNSNSRWESNSTDNEWICLDLGKKCDISKVTIQWEAAAGKTYDIQVSDDGVNWKTVHTVTDGQNGAYLDVDLNNASGRYVRVLGKERTTPYGYSIYELGVYSNVDDSYFVNQNLALGKVAGASSGNGALAVDGNGGSRWESTFVDNQYVYVDLGAEYRIDTVKLIWEAAYGKGYTIETSTDGSNWNVVYTENAGDGDTDTISLSNVTARFVMVYGTKRGTNYGFSLWEMEVYGGLKDAATKPEETEPSVEESSEVSTEASSEESSEETEAPSAPEVIKPVKVTALNAVYENGKIKLTWEDNGAAKYRVMRFDSINPGYTTLTYSATAGGYVDTDLIDAHRYYYRVCGYFYDAEGKLVQGSVSDSAGVVATDREPGKVENVKAVVDGRTVTLTWDAPEGVRYYKLARAYGATAAEGSYGTLKYNVEETTYTDTTVKYGGTFRYKVVGYYKAVDGSWTYGAMSDTLFVTIK